MRIGLHPSFGRYLQIAYTTISGSGGKVSQGVQQAYEIYSVGIEDWVAGIAFSVFPNPTTDQVTLEVEGSHPLPMACRSSSK